VLEVEGDADSACIVDLVLSGSGGEALDADVVDCLGIVYEVIQLDCEDENACNFMESGDCIYPEENYDCDGNCIVDLDCEGECGGNAVVDDCGECNGDGSSCGDGCSEDTEVCLSIGEGDGEGGTFLDYQSTADIAGFQFNHNGCIETASGGDAEANGFTVSASATTVLAFSFTGSVIPAGDGNLLVLTGDISQDCLFDFIFSDADGDALVVNFEEGDDGPPDCILDCAGLEEFETETEVCEFVVSIYGDSCLDDCDDQTMEEIEEYYNYCEACLAAGNCDDNEEISEIEIYYSSEADIAGFQFNMDGVSIISASGGDAEANGFSVSTSEITVLGFSFTGSVIPAGSGLLTVLEVEGDVDSACIVDLVLSGSGGEALEAEVEDCVGIIYEEPDEPVDSCSDIDIYNLNLANNNYPQYENANVMLGCVWNAVNTAGLNNASSISNFIVNVCGWGGFIGIDCIDCYGEIGACMASSCDNECSDGWYGAFDDCADCMGDNCFDDFSDCSGVYYGCQDEYGCNYDENANAGSDNIECLYPDFNFDCDGDCVVDVDCNGECGGDAVVDDCGECDGNNSSCVLPCDEDTEVCLSLNGGDLNYDSTEDIAGFQFNHNGCVEAAYGGDAEANGFMISSSDAAVIAFSLTGAVVPTGEGTLVELDGDVTGDCLFSFIFSDSNGDALIVGFEDGGDDGGDGGGTDTQYFTDLPAQTGESSLIIIQDIIGLDEGDEVGLFDANGVVESCIPDYGCTEAEYGEVLVASGVWQGEQLELVAVMSIDLSDFNGPILNGAVEGDSIVVRVWDQDQDLEHDASASYSQGNGTYGQVITVIDVLDAYIYGCTDENALNYDSQANMDDGSCNYTVEQAINLDAYQMNNISFNVNVSDYYSTSDLFDQVNILLAYDDVDDYYVPQFGINQIDLNYSQG